jgi:hypothetical protein
MAFQTLSGELAINGIVIEGESKWDTFETTEITPKLAKTVLTSKVRSLATLELEATSSNAGLRAVQGNVLLTADEGSVVTSGTGETLISTSGGINVDTGYAGVPDVSGDYSKNDHVVYFSETDNKFNKALNQSAFYSITSDETAVFSPWIVNFQRSPNPMIILTNSRAGVFNFAGGQFSGFLGDHTVHYSIRVDDIVVGNRVTVQWGGGIGIMGNSFIPESVTTSHTFTGSFKYHGGVSGNLLACVINSTITGATISGNTDFGFSTWVQFCKC